MVAKQLYATPSRADGHPAVENTGVIGVDDLLHGENMRAYVGTSRSPTSGEPLEGKRKNSSRSSRNDLI